MTELEPCPHCGRGVYPEEQDVVLMVREDPQRLPDGRVAGYRATFRWLHRDCGPLADGWRVVDPPGDD